MAQQPINFKTSKVHNNNLPITPSKLKRDLEDDNTRFEQFAKRAKITVDINTTPSTTISSNTIANIASSTAALPDSIDDSSDHLLTPADDTNNDQPPPPPRPQYKGFTSLYRENHLYLTVQTFMSPIPPRQQRPGTLYLFTRPGDPNHVKIGTTYNAISERASKVRRVCKFKPNLEVVLQDVPFAMRVEFMIHKELEWLGLRRMEEVCKFGGSNLDDNNDALNHKPCRGRHREWFEVPIREDTGAQWLMERWVYLFRYARPYNEDGMLKKEWASRILGLPGDKQVLTIDVLLALWTEIKQPDLSVTMGLVDRQIVWALQRKEKRWWFERIVKERNEREAKSRAQKGESDAHEVEEAKARVDTGCTREWFSDAPGERCSLGCTNLDHGGRVCVYEMVCEFRPFGAMTM